MQIKVLGTAAAECFPGIWCDCETCMKARAKGDPKDLRRRASYLLDDDTMIDLGPDAYWQSVAFHIDYLKLKRVLFTHCHTDHLNGGELSWRRCGFCHCPPGMLKVFASYVTFVELQEWLLHHEFVRSLQDIFVEPVTLEHGKPVTDGDLTILPMDADHAPGKQPLIYLLTRGGKSVLIGNDTGYFLPQTWEALKGHYIDIALMDSTMGIKYADGERGHMGVHVVVKAVERLRQMGCLDAHSQVFATHFSHNGGAIHSELEAFYAPHGIGVAYDGLTVKV